LYVHLKGSFSVHNRCYNTFTCKTIFVLHVLRSVQKSYSRPTTLVRKRTTHSGDLNIGASVNGKHAGVMHGLRVKLIFKPSKFECWLASPCKVLIKKLCLSTQEYNCLLFRRIRDSVSDQSTKSSVLTLKGHSTIDCLKDFEPDALKTFCTLRALSFKISRRLFEL